MGNDASSNSTISNNLIRSHSHSNVNKPSQDLLGLTLHEISDPIEAPVTSTFANNAQEGEPRSNTSNNIFDISKESEPENQYGASDIGTLCNTSKGKRVHCCTLCFYKEAFEDP